jgi:class 3 adenylate cyclase/streptogramin lyase
MPRRTTRSGRELTTVMFTDVVGSTERAAELGDAQWKKLLGAHNAAMRRLLKRHGGREVDTSGDGFFMTFDQPAHAIECGLDMIDTLAGIGIHIRAGVHFGEVEVMDGKIAGMTVHIGARIMAQGGADELIVSSTVRDLMTGSELPFDDRGFQQLKGVDSQWHLYAVAGRVREREELTVGEPAPSAPPWRQPVVIAAAATALLAVAAAAFAFTRGGDEAAAPKVNTLVQLDGDTVAAVVPVGSAPQAIAVQDTTIWVANTLDFTIQRVDTGSRTAQPAEGGLNDPPTSLAVGDGFVWIGSSLTSDGTIVRVDPAEQNSAKEIVELGGQMSGLATAPGFVWATDHDADVIRRLDIEAEEVTELRLPKGSGPTGLVAEGDSLWVALHDARQVVQVDPATGEILASVGVEAGPPDRVAVGGGYVWVSVGDGDAILRIEPEDASLFTIPGACDGPAGIAVADEGVWVACTLDGRVLRLDAASGDTVDEVQLGAGLGPSAIAVTDDGVWVSLIGR